MSAVQETYLLAKIAELEAKLAEADQLIDAIRSGEVDAFAFNRNNQQEIFTLQSGDYAYRLLVESFVEGAVNLTEDGLIVYTNNYFYGLLGLPYEQVIGTMIDKFIHPDSKSKFNTLFKSGLAGQSKGEIFLLSGKRKIPVYISLTSLYPKLPSVGMIVTDLSDKMEQEKVLLEKNDFIETLLDSSVDIIIVVDKEMKHISLNKKARKIYERYFSGDAIGKKLDEVITDESIISSVKQAFTGKSLQSREFSGFIAGKYYDIDYVPVMKRSVVSAVMMILRDVTDMVRKKEEVILSNQKLRERNEFIETIIEASEEIIAVYDASCTLLTMNRACEEFMGVSKSEVIGRKFTEFNPGAKGTNAESDLLRALSGEQIKNEPYYSASYKRYLQNYLTPLYDQHGKVYAALVIGHDVTDLKLADDAILAANKELEEKNEALARSNAELASFSYIASHDLQEPLRKIHTFSGRIMEKEYNNLSENGRMMFDRMQLATRRMQSLIEDLLAYSRTNNTVKTFEKVNLQELVDEVKNDLKEDIREKKALIESDGLGEANILRFQFRQIFHNLIGNSLKFSDKDNAPHIKIKYRTGKGQELGHPRLVESRDYFHLSVSDNGIGFEPKFREKIFELFLRLNGREEYRGTGIGLAIVKRIVENHNGIITADSEPNKGARFDIFIPKA
jgi:PAS domain S-box-containing protein